MKRTIESIQPNEVILCKTPREQEKLQKLLREAGKKWCNGEDYNFPITSSPTCYNVNAGEHSTEKFYREIYNKTIVSATDFIEDGRTLEECLTDLEKTKIEFIKEDSYELKLRKEIRELRVHLNEFSVALTTMFPKEVKSVPYQLCPMCGGKKKIRKAVEKFKNRVINHDFDCDICKGEGIIPQHVIE